MLGKLLLGSAAAVLLAVPATVSAQNPLGTVQNLRGDRQAVQADVVPVNWHMHHNYYRGAGAGYPWGSYYGYSMGYPHGLSYGSYYPPSYYNRQYSYPYYYGGYTYPNYSNYSQPYYPYSSYYYQPYYGRGWY